MALTCALVVADGAELAPGVDDEDDEDEDEDLLELLQPTTRTVAAAAVIRMRCRGPNMGVHCR
jgi:hypothetical protein